MGTHHHVILSLAAFTALITAAAAGTSPASAGAPFSEYSCKELWTERNGVFANKGHCFTSAKAIAVFGKGCFAPYGELTKTETKVVNEIKKWEAIKNCN